MKLSNVVVNFRSRLSRCMKSHINHNYPIRRSFCRSSDQEQNDWIARYDEITKANHFELDIDRNNFEQLKHYHIVSKPTYRWLSVLIASNNPLRYEEFMCGAYDGMRYILQCIEQNDIDGLQQCVHQDVLQQFDEMKQFMLDEKYNKVDKLMLYLKEFENAPNWQDMSINAQFSVTYYYQLRCAEENDNLDFIQKRVDIIWQSLWLPADNATFEISEAGWKVTDIQCIDIPPSSS